MLRSVIFDKLLTSFANLSVQQTRNAYVLKRRWPPGLHKIGGKAPKLRARHFIYDTIRITDTEKSPRVKVILTQYVEGLGDVGDILELGAYESYNKVLLPLMGVYCTPENMKKYCVEDGATRKVKKFSSPFVEKTLRELHQMSLPIIMNYYNDWTLQPWHVKMAFRNNGYHVPDYAIELPEKPINGPNVELEEKEFLVTVTINKTEKTQVRCRIFHHALASEKRDMPLDFVNVARAPLFPEEADILASMPLPEYVPPPTNSKFGLARRRAPKRLPARYYVYDTEYNRSHYQKWEKK